MSPSRGALALARVLEGRTRVDVAELVGCDASYVGMLAHGKRKPSPALRARLEERLAIPSADWDATDAPAKNHSATVDKFSKGFAAPAETAANLCRNSTSLPGPGDAKRETAYARALLHVATTEKMVQETLSSAASPREKAAVAAAHSGAVAMLGRVEPTWVRILESPEWKAIQKTILDAIRPWPEAAEAIGNALLALDAERDEAVRELLGPT